MFDEFKYAPGFEHFDYADPDAPKGGTLVLPTELYFTGFTPFRPLGLPAIGAAAPGMLYDGLFVLANDEPFIVYGNLAGRVKFADDLSEMRVQLRPEAYWHDRVPISAIGREVHFRSCAQQIWLGHWLGAVDLRVRRDSRSVRGAVSIQTGQRTERDSFASPAIYVNILPEHYWRTRDLTKNTLEPPLGRGPYRLADFEQGKFLLYERVPDYCGRDLAVHGAGTTLITYVTSPIATRRSPGRRFARGCWRMSFRVTLAS